MSKSQGRPVRNDADYFPHWVSHGKTMRFIEKKYDKGYQVWMKILEELTTTDYHYLNLNNEDLLTDLSDMCNEDEGIIVNIIDDMAKRNKFNKHLWTKHKIVWSPFFIEKIQKLYTRRENECITLDGLYDMLKIEKPPDPEPELPMGDIPVVMPYNKELEEIIKYFPGKLTPSTKAQKDDWRKCIRLLIETDKFQFDQILDIIKWGRTKGNWWYDNGNFLSLLKLRNKNKDKIKYVDVFMEQMNKNKSKEKSNTSDVKNFTDSNMNYEEN